MGSSPLPFAVARAGEQTLVQALFRQAATGVALLDLDGRYIAANEAMCTLLGRPEAELRGRSWRDSTHPDDVAECERLLADLGERQEMQGEKRYVRPDGTSRWALAGTSFLHDEHGEPAGFLTQVADITDRKLAEEALRAERAHLEVLSAVSVALNESNTAEHAFRVVVNAVCAHTAWPVGHAVTLEDDRLVSAGVWVAAEPGNTEHLRTSVSDRPLHAAGAAGRAARDRAPAWSDHEGPGRGWRAAGVEGVGAWPVVADGAVLAVLEFGAVHPEPPSEALGTVLTSVCSQLAQALQRAATLQALRSSEQQLSEAYALAGLGSWRWDVATGEVDWSDELFRLLGRRPRSVKPSLEWFMAHVHDDDREHVRAQLERTLVTGERLVFESRLVCADGRTRTVLGGGEVAAYEARRPRRLVGYLQDITARAEAQAALARSEERVRLILATSSDAFVEYDIDRIVVEWNRAAEALFGWTHAEAVGERIDDLLDPNPGGHLRSLLTALDSPALDTAVEATARRRDGADVPVDVTIPRTPDAVLRSTFLRDISERKRAEQVLRETNASLRTSLAALEVRSREVAILNEMIDVLQSATEAAEGYRVIARHAELLFPGLAGGVFVAEHGTYKAIAEWGDLDPPERALDREDCWALRRGRLHRAEPGAASLNCPHTRHEQRATICAPMTVQGEAVGLVHLAVTDPAVDGQEKDLLVTDFAERTALALANMQLRARLHSQSIRDPLTGLYNRRYLEETFERELTRAQRNRYPLGVAMIDLDRFKRFNDRFGHQVGDDALRAFGRYLVTHVRTDDVACRYGGEEFVVLFPNAGRQQVRERCEALRAGLEALELVETDWQSTISIGVAAYPDHGDATATLLQAADAALYEAKRSGRDRVIVAEPA